MFFIFEKEALLIGIISSDKSIGLLKMYEREFKKECCLLLGSTTNEVRA